MVTEEPLVLGGSGRWRPADGGDGLVLKERARLWIHVADRSSSDEPLRIHIRPTAADTAGDASVRYVVRWDDEPLIDPPRPLGEIVVPAALLDPGTHSLHLEPAPESTPDGAPAPEPEVEPIVVTRGTVRLVFGQDRYAEVLQVGEYLRFGGTGRSAIKHAGWLFLGPGTHSGSLARVQGRPSDRWQAPVENLSDQPVTVRITSTDMDGVAQAQVLEVPPTARRTARFVADPAHPVHVRVLGAPDLRMLFGRPALDAPRTERPPIVLITLDTTRKDALTPYGAPTDATPALAEFAAGASVYDNAFATAPWTLPSHASMFTGRFPSQHGAGVDRTALPDTFDTLAEGLAADGYVTGGFAGGYMMAYRFGVGQGFHVYRNPDAFETRGERMTLYAERFLRQHGASDLFLFLNFFDPHWTYDPPDDLRARFDLDRLGEALRERPVWQEALAGDEQAWRRIYYGGVTVDAAARAYLEAAYAAEVAALDRQVAKVFDALRAHDLYDDALIVLVADHGEHLGEDGRFIGHGYRLSNELVEIPLLVKWPGQTEGTRVGHLASQVDLYPTLLAVARGQQPAPAGEGPVATDLRSLPRPAWTVSEEHASSLHPLVVGEQVIAHHLLRLQEQAFYQVIWDGGTRCGNKVASTWQDAPCPDEGVRARARLADWLLDRDESDQEMLDAEATEALRALGYL